MHDIDIDKLEKLIIRIAIFSVLYTFPGMSLPISYAPIIRSYHMDHMI